MPGVLRSALRLEETRDGLSGLEAEIVNWTAHRLDDGPQYTTQLETLRTALRGLLRTTNCATNGIDVAGSVGEVYARCRDADAQAALVRRIWDWFKVKWDQRDDDRFGKALEAADEIVWSCYCEPFVQRGETPAAAPLPFFEAEYGPHAVTRAAVPPNLKSEKLLAKATERLPVPVTGMPPVCATRPWWLVLLAHETGHHVYLDLAGGALERDFAAQIEAAAPAAAGALADGRWALWAREVFADAYATFTVGPAAAWAINELETAPDGDLLVNPSQYPPRLVRQTLTEHLLTQAKVPDGDSVPPRRRLRPLDDLEIDAAAEPMRTRIRLQLDEARRVAAVLGTADLAGVGRLEELCDFSPARFAPGGRVYEWEQAFLARRAEAEKSDGAARAAIAGGVSAWCKVATGDFTDERRAELRDGLAQDLLEIVPKCRAQETRDGGTAQPVDDLITDLGGELLTIAADEEATP